MWCCGHCINAIRSHGEKIFVGPEMDYDEYEEENGDPPVCEWCEEGDVELFEVEWR